MHAGRIAVAAVWVATAVGVAAILVLAPGEAALRWLALAIGLSVAVGMAGQLVVAERAGFVVRLAASASGSFLIVAVGALLAFAAA